jgi:hypothetical protein
MQTAVAPKIAVAKPHAIHHCFIARSLSQKLSAVENPIIGVAFEVATIPHPATRINQMMRFGTGSKHGKVDEAYPLALSAVAIRIHASQAID